MLVAVQLSATGLYLPPVLKTLLLAPPQTIISVPVQTAVWHERPCGAFINANRSPTVDGRIVFLTCVQTAV